MKHRLVVLVSLLLLFACLLVGGLAWPVSTEAMPNGSHVPLLGAASVELPGGRSPLPFIGVFTPMSGPPGTKVTILGGNLASTIDVKFNGVMGTDLAIVDDNQISAKVPVGAKTGKIAVTNSFGTTLSDQDFTVTTPSPPTITGLDVPPTTTWGSAIDIYGTHFYDVSAVIVNDAAASFNVVNPSQIGAVIPPRTTSGPVTVVTPYGTAVSEETILITPPLPIIEMIDPMAGSWFNPIVCQGTGLYDVDQIGIGGTLCKCDDVCPCSVVEDGTEFEFHVPPGAQTGPVTVWTPFGSDTTGSDFTVTPTGNESPVCQQCSPPSGHAGDEITCSGVNFYNTREVRFGDDYSAAVFEANETGTEVWVTAPDGPPPGPIDITISTPWGETTCDPGWFYENGVSSFKIHLPLVLRQN